MCVCVCSTLIFRQARKIHDDDIEILTCLLLVAAQVKTNLKRETRNKIHIDYHSREKESVVCANSIRRNRKKLVLLELCYAK